MSRTNRTLLGDVIKIGIVRLCAFAVISLSSLFGFATQAGAQGIFNGTWSGTSVWIASRPSNSLSDFVQSDILLGPLN